MRAKSGTRLDRHVANTSVRFAPASTIFSTGDRCGEVMYIRRGRVRLTVKSPAGRETEVAVLAAGMFFGEGALAGQRRRRTTATAMTASTISMVKTADMRRGLHETALSDWFRMQLLATNSRIEAELVDVLFNHCEKRLARLLLALAHFDEHQQPRSELPRISRALLAEVLGTTRSNIDRLMRKFLRVGFLERAGNGGTLVHRSMLSVVLQE